MIRILFSTILVVSLLSGILAFSANDILSFDQPIDPDLYLIRPGDQLVVTFVNLNIDSLVLKVNPEGRIVHRTLGVFDISNRTLSKAIDILMNEILKLYNSEQAVISITKPIPVSINIIGAVAKPGRYKGFTSDRVSDILRKTGGLLNDGSRRNITFLGGPNKLRVDLDKADYFGDIMSDPSLYAGSMIVVPGKTSDVVHVVGEVNSPKELELLPGDDISLLITLAAGFRGSADRSGVYIIRGDQKITDLDNILPGDIIMVPRYMESKSERTAAIFGAIENPGYYKFDDNLTLETLISTSGGYLEDANSGLVTVFRKPSLDMAGRVTSLRYPISRMLDNANQFMTIKLASDDSVFVPVKVGYVSVKGEVFNPGYYPYIKGNNADFFINNSGGFLNTANKKEILFYNPVSGITSIISTGVIIPDGAELVVQKKEELK